MARFNKNKVQGPQLTTNLAGGSGFEMDNTSELLTILLTSFYKDTFYRDTNMLETQLDKAYSNVKPIVAAKMTVFSRELGMRSITHAMVSKIVNDSRTNGETWKKDFVAGAIQRVDDMTEIMSYYINKYGKPIPNALKRGMSKAFNKFDDYQLAKYRGNNKEVSLVDLINLVHPTPTKKNVTTLEKLVANASTAKENKTWENVLSETGQGVTTKEEKLQNKKEAWGEMIESGRLGLFATLRNLCNIAETAPEYLDLALKVFYDRKKVLASKLFPYRYFTAMQEVNKRVMNDAQVIKITKALVTASEFSLDLLPELEGNVAVVVDISGSMSNHVHSLVPLVSLIIKKYNARLITYSNHVVYDSIIKAPKANVAVNYKEVPLGSILNSVRERIVDDCGGGTNATSAVKALLNQNVSVSHVFWFSDEQTWMDGNTGVREMDKHLVELSKNTGVTPMIYSVDVNGYGTQMFRGNRIILLAGVSDKLFALIPYIKNGYSGLVDYISKLNLF